MSLYPGFVGGHGEGFAPGASGQVTQNLFVEKQPPGSKVDTILRMAYGTAQALDLGAGPVRGMFSVENYIFAVSGNNVWMIRPNRTVVLLGMVGDDARYLSQTVSMANDKIQTFLVAAGVGFQVTDAVVTAVVSPPWTYLVDCCFMDDTFFALDDNGLTTGGTVYFSGVNDALSWDSLDFFTAPASANKLRRVFVDHQRLWVFGSLSTQGFYDTGDLNSPFVPDKSAVIQIGIGATWSLQRLENPAGGSNLIWLSANESGSGTIVKMVGFEVVKISNSGIDALLFSGGFSDATSMTFQIQGTSVYQLNLPSIGVSLRYNASVAPADAWSICGWQNLDTGLQEAHRGVCHVVQTGDHLIGDRETGVLWHFGPEYLTDDEDGDEEHPIVWIRRPPIQTFGGRRAYFREDIADIEPGVGTDRELTDGTNDPQMFHRYSNDGGKTWSQKRGRSMGKLGDYNAQPRWLNCGSGRNRQIELSGAAAVQTAIFQLFQTVEIGRN